jgi:hypothetical protein
VGLGVDVGAGVGVAVGVGLSDGVGESVAVGVARGLGDRLGRGGLAVTTRPVGLGLLEGVEVELRPVEALGVAVGAGDCWAWLGVVGVGATG